MSAAQPGLRCVLFALRRESMYFRRLVRPLQRLASAPCAAFLGGGSDDPLLMMETGVGRGAVKMALDWLLQGPREPSLLVYAGFAGALVNEYTVGDVLVADVVMNEAGRTWSTNWPDPASSASRCRLLTVDRLVATPLDKHQLGERYGAQAVEMEAAHVAARCAQHGVPFGCVRALSDALDTSLSPELVHLLSGSRVSVARLAACIARRPAILRELLRLQHDTRRAAHQLAVALHALLGVPRK